MKLKQILLYVKDFDALAQFYSEALGLHPIEESRSAGWLEFAEGLALHAIPEHIAKDIVITSPPGVREETPMKPIFQTDDLEGACTKLEAAGVAVTRYAWGAADCVDPEGNVFQVSR